MMDIRPTGRGDIAAVDAMLADSYPRLLKQDYPPSVMVTALPLISKARPELVTSGSYFGVWDADGVLVAAGGWTKAGPNGEAAQAGSGHIRHFVTDYRHIRRGYARKLMDHIFGHSKGCGTRRLECSSTRTAVPFYEAMGFEVVGPLIIQLRAGVIFPAVAMTRAL